ncbi:hypothetical protein C8R45DRAFT_554929 [Mycena sanguinolenta]|nr:hypothetical protein C8R45DRAFT_554929 [Mycena sanguinolenta]
MREVASAPTSDVPVSVHSIWENRLHDGPISVEASTPAFHVRRRAEATSNIKADLRQRVTVTRAQTVKQYHRRAERVRLRGGMGMEGAEWNGGLGSDNLLVVPHDVGLLLASSTSMLSSASSFPRRLVHRIRLVRPRFYCFASDFLHIHHPYSSTQTYRVVRAVDGCPQRVRRTHDDDGEDVPPTPRGALTFHRGSSPCSVAARDEARLGEGHEGERVQAPKHARGRSDEDYLGAGVSRLGT